MIHGELLQIPQPLIHHNKTKQYMFTVTVTLTTAGADTGPFNIFSDASTPPYSSALNASPISRNDMLTGVTLTNVPDGTTILRVQSTGVCQSSIDIPVNTPTKCAMFLFQGAASVGNIIEYRDCATEIDMSATLDYGMSMIVCAYKEVPYYPAFTSGTGTITLLGSCGPTGKLGCAQYLFYAFPGEGGATFRYIPCDESTSIEVSLSEGDTSIVCTNPYFIPQVASGNGSVTDMEVICTTTTTTTAAP